MSGPRDTVSSMQLNDSSMASEDFDMGGNGRWQYNMFKPTHPHKLSPQELMVPMNDDRYDDLDGDEHHDAFSNFVDNVSPTKHVRSAQYSNDSITHNASTAELLGLMGGDHYLLGSTSGMGVRAHSMTNLSRANGLHPRESNNSAGQSGRLSTMGHRSLSVSNFQSVEPNSLFADSVGLGRPRPEVQSQTRSWDDVDISNHQQQPLRYKVNQNRGFSSLYPASTGNLGGLIGNGNGNSIQNRYDELRAEISQSEQQESWGKSLTPQNRMQHYSVDSALIDPSERRNTRPNLVYNRSDTDLVASFDRMMSLGVERRSLSSPNSNSLEGGIPLNSTLGGPTGTLDDHSAMLDHALSANTDVPRLPNVSSSLSLSNLSSSSISNHQGFPSSQVTSHSPSDGSRNPPFSGSSLNSQGYTSSGGYGKYVNGTEKVTRQRGAPISQFQPPYYPHSHNQNQYDRHVQVPSHMLPHHQNFNVRERDMHVNMHANMHNRSISPYANMGMESATPHMQNMFAQDQIALCNAILMNHSMTSGLRFPGMVMPGLNMNGLNMLDMANLAAAAQMAGGASMSRGGYGGMYGGGGYDRRDFGGNEGVGMYDDREQRRSVYDYLDDPGDGNMYQVRFKRGVRMFLLSRGCERTLKIGDYVKVEADRGEDLGVIVSVTPVPDAGASLKPPTAGHRQRSIGLSQCERERILRAANEHEMETVKENMIDEERVLAVCRAKVAQRGLPMEVMDAEYQYDRHKLTFFFQAEGRIDFRELVRDLFALYKTRIWMQQVDSNHITTPMPMPGGQNSLNSHNSDKHIAQAGIYIDANAHDSSDLVSSVQLSAHEVDSLNRCADNKTDSQS